MADEVNTSQGMEYEIATADSGVVKSLDKLCDALNNVYKNLEKIEDASDDAFDAGKVDRMTNAMGKIADQLAAAAQRFDQSTERMLSAMENSSKSSRKSTTRKSSKKSEPEPVETNFDNINPHTPDINKANTESSKQTNPLDIYKQEIDSLFEDYVKLTDKLGQSTSARGMETLRAQIESVIEQLNQMSRLYDAVASRSDDKASIPGYNETMAKSGLANDVFADQKKAFAKLDISEYEKQIQSLMSKLNALSNKSVKTNLDQTEVTRYQELIRQVSELQLRLSELSKEHKINIDTSATEQQIESLQSQLNQIMSGSNNSTRRMKFSMSTLISMAKQLPSSFSRAFKTVHKIANVFSKIGRFISRCVKRIGSFVKHLFKAKRHTTSLSSEFKYFLRMLSSATLFRTFSKITDSMAEAKDALARISDTYNASLSKLQTSLNATRNAIVSAFAPIQSLFNGPFTSVMALIERAADKIGMAFAALNGQDVYEKLTQDAVNYRDTLEDVNKAQKQVIGGLDELNILQENKDKTDEFNFRVEYVTIDKGVSGIFKRIRELWKSGEYKRTGEFIAEQINAWFSGLEINDFFAPIKQATDSVITALNGFIEKFDGALLGEQMGKFVTGLVDIMADIVENGEWDKFISKFGEAMKTFITSLPAERIGSMMGNVITIILNSILTIAEVLTDDEVVNQIILALETAIDKINEFFDDPAHVERMGTTLGKLINGVVRIVNTITKKLNLSPVLDALNLALETTDQGQLKSGINNLTSIIENAFTSDFVSNIAAIIAKGVLSAIETVLKYMVLGLVVIVESALNLLLTPFVGIIENVNKLLNLVGVDTSGIISPDFGVKSMWKDHAISKAIGIQMGIIEPEVKGNYIANPTNEQLEAYRQQVGDEMYQKYLENVGKSNADSYIGGWNSGDWDSLVDGLMGDKMGGGKASQNGGAGFGATKHGGGGGAFEYGRSVADEYRRGFSSADWVQTGRFASDGIMQGMDSAFAGVQRWGRDFLAATQDVFMIASPSKLFRKFVGKFLGLGIALGLYDSTPAMLKSVDSASDSMIREFDKKPIRLNKFTARGSVSIPDTATSKIGGANNRAFDDRQDNNGVVGAIETMTYKIVDAVKEKTTDAYIDGQKVTDNVSARQSARVKMTGKPAMA